MRRLAGGVLRHSVFILSCPREPVRRVSALPSRPSLPLTHTHPHPAMPRYRSRPRRSRRSRTRRRFRASYPPKYDLETNVQYVATRSSKTTGAVVEVVFTCLGVGEELGKPNYKVQIDTVTPENSKEYKHLIHEQPTSVFWLINHFFIDGNAIPEERARFVVRPKRHVIDIPPTDEGTRRLSRSYRATRSKRRGRGRRS